MNILFWDIDGTLIRTSKAGLYAFAQATAELWDKSINFEEIKAAGMTDHYIAAQIIQKTTGRDPFEGEIIALTQRYEQLLPIHLAAREGQVMPSILAILDELQGQDEYKMLLLTGNSRIGAEIKLSYFGLKQYFDYSRSAFCDRHFEREGIAQYALATMKSAYGSAKALRLFVIGDTPHDIQCGKAIGAYTIGVATGTYSLHQLSGYSPWWAVDALPSVDVFITKINEIDCLS